jgi:hypothetical protein
MVSEKARTTKPAVRATCLLPKRKYRFQPMTRIKMMFVVLLFVDLVPSLARAQSKAGKLCVWADSEDPGIVMPTQPGGSVNSISGSEVSFIQQMIVAGLRADKTNNVVDPCPRTGENIELDVVIGQFLGGYVASVSIVIQGGKEGPLHVSSNVVAAKTDKLLAWDVAMAYASTKFRLGIGR